MEDEEEVEEVDETTPLSLVSANFTSHNQSINHNRTINAGNSLGINQPLLSGPICFRSPIRGGNVMVRSRQDNESTNLKNGKAKSLKLHLSTLNASASPDLSPRYNSFSYKCQTLLHILYIIYIFALNLKDRNIVLIM